MAAAAIQLGTGTPLQQLAQIEKYCLTNPDNIGLESAIEAIRYHLNTGWFNYRYNIAPDAILTHVTAKRGWPVGGALLEDVVWRTRDEVTQLDRRIADLLKKTLNIHLNPGTQEIHLLDEINDIVAKEGDILVKALKRDWARPRTLLQQLAHIEEYCLANPSIELGYWRDAAKAIQLWLHDNTKFAAAQEAIFALATGIQLRDLPKENVYMRNEVPPLKKRISDLLEKILSFAPSNPGAQEINLRDEIIDIANKEGTRLVAAVERENDSGTVCTIS